MKLLVAAAALAAALVPGAGAQTERPLTLDSGGPAARYRDPRPYPDLAFTQQLSPEFAPPGWRPMYIDYLVLGLTTSTAFSPTDVMPMVHWAKLTMTLQSLISLTVIALVIARAVNAFA